MIFVHPCACANLLFCYHYLCALLCANLLLLLFCYHYDLCSPLCSANLLLLLLCYHYLCSLLCYYCYFAIIMIFVHPCACANLLLLLFCYYYLLLTPGVGATLLLLLLSLADSRSIIMLLYYYCYFAIIIPCSLLCTILLLKLLCDSAGVRTPRVRGCGKGGAGPDRGQCQATRAMWKCPMISKSNGRGICQRHSNSCIHAY